MNTLLQSSKIKDICEQNDITYLGLFGSFARGEQTPKSDVDLLVDFGEVKSLFELVRIEGLFEKTLQNKVDLVIQKNLKERIKPYIYRDLKMLYEKR